MTEDREEKLRLRPWPDRHEPTAHLVMGCGVAAFTGVWTLACGFIVLLIIGAQPSDFHEGSRASLALHELALFQLPFIYPAVLFWWVAASQFRQVRLRPAGLAVVRSTPDGWLAEVPNSTGLQFAIGTFQLTLFLTALTPLLLLGKRNPLWVWYLAGPLAVLLGLAAFRCWHHRPAVRIDKRRRTLSLSRGRWKPALVVPWDAVLAIQVICVSSEENNQYDCQVTARVGEQTESVRYGGGYGYPEPAERFAAWLRDHVCVGVVPPE